MIAPRWPLLLLLALVIADIAHAEPPKQVTAHPRGETDITIDGVLDEAPWSHAQVATGFVEREPYPGTAPPVTTEFRVLYDAEHIYVGVVCWLEPGESPRALELQRDNFAIFSDDALSLKFDARLDERTTVGFATNPAGAQLDYVVVDNGEFRREFDALWDVATKVHEDRWVVEFEIPNVALGLPGERGSRTIGLNVTRDHNLRLATYDWNEMPPEFGPTSALHYGRVHGLVDVAGGRTLTLIPYALGGYTNVGDEPLEGKVGGDLRFRPTSDVWTELTLFTDFAQVDLDDPILNLDRFPLFFPERRPFFLTGLDVFDVGIPGFVQPFFTRRIGLDEDANVVPLLGGLKVYGSYDDFRFGVLEVITGEDGAAPAENFTVGRIRYNWGEHGHLGVIATFNGEVSDRPNAVENPLDPGYTVGVDGILRGYDKRLQLSSFWTGSLNQVAGEDVVGHSGRAELAWRGTYVLPSFSFTYISEDYDPLVGFVVRNDLMESRMNLQWTYRTEEWGLRNVVFGAAGQMVHDYGATMRLGQLATGWFTATLDNGWNFGSGATFKEDFVQEAFEVVPGRTVDVGYYRGIEADVYLASPGGRNPSGNVSYLINDALFGGRRHAFRASGAVRLGPHFSASFDADYSIITFPDFETTRALVGVARAAVVPSTTLAIDFIGQANALDDVAAALVRVRWRYLPGSDVFLIYRENFDFSEAGDRAGRSVALKVTYRYDAVL